MASTRNFTISTPAQSIRADAGGRADVIYTVANASGLPNRAMARVVPIGDTRAEWLALEGENERDFPIGGIHQFTVSAKFPSDAPSARYSLRLDILSARKGGEEAYAGPVVTIETTSAAAPPPSRWWIWAAAALLLLVVGVAGALMMRSRDVVEDTPPVVEATDTVTTTTVTTTTTAPPQPDIFLSDLDASVRRAPHEGLVVDQTYWKTPIVIAGKKYDRGLFAHARNDQQVAIVEYQAPAGARSFRAIVGLVEPCPTSSVQFGVAVNGKGIFLSDVLRGAEQQVVPPIDVREGDILTLSVNDGSDGNHCDHSAWGGARFVR